MLQHHGNWNVLNQSQEVQSIHISVNQFKEHQPFELTTYKIGKNLFHFLLLQIMPKIGFQTSFN